MMNAPAACRWCGGPFALAVRGGNIKLFCSPICRGQFHSAARRWAEWALAEGKITLGEIKHAGMPPDTMTNCAPLSRVKDERANGGG